jgi:phage tail sheath protein FI
MAVQVSYPGVYIDEFAPGAPIQGVGTSTAAFIGPAVSGDINVPTLITSIDQFHAVFGKQPVAGFYLWHAAKGFFENRGTECYVVRASNGDYQSATLQDRAGAPHDLIQVRALHPGIPAQNIQLNVSDAHLLQNANLYQPIGQYTAINGRTLTLSPGDGSKFKAGDRVLLAGSTQAVPVFRVAGDSLRLAEDVVPPPNPNGTIRLADIVPGTLTVRVRPAAQLPSGVLVPGTMLTIQQNANRDTQMVDSVQTELGNPTTYRVSFRQGLKVGFSLDPNVGAAPVTSDEFTLSVTQAASTTTYDSLSIEAAHPNYYVNAINGVDDLITVRPVQPPSPSAPPNNLPALGVTNLAGGANENLAALLAPNTGDPYFVHAIDALLPISDVNLVAVPGRTSPTVQQAVIAHCEQMGDRFGVLDSAIGISPFDPGNNVEIQRQGLDSTRGYAAFYYPWLLVPPVGAGAPILVPPSGHVCGIMAQVDNTRGVHKAPANVLVNSALDVERTLSDTDQGILNLAGINVIRVFRAGGRPIVWGARTTATDTNWQYVNIRRLFLFLEKSIQEGIRWAVFEPNNTGLWEKLRRTITDFLTRVWRDGALFGETADKAFYVRIDETLNPDSERALGRLHIEIGVRPSYPAEFIIVRIGIWYGGSQVTEG